MVTIQAARVDELDNPAYQGNFPRPSGDGSPSNLPVNLDPSSPLDPSRQLVVSMVWESGPEPAQQQLSSSERIMRRQNWGIRGDIVDGLPNEQLLHVWVSRRARWTGLGIDNVAPVGYRCRRPGARNINA